MTEYKSQIGQDKFVVETFKGKRDRTFLDVGCSHYHDLSNTYYLEKELNWRGIGVEIDGNFKSGWYENRKTPFICHDALTLDYNTLLKEHNMPLVIDYLSLDLEPPVLSLQALYKIFESDFSFNVITFETDIYRESSTEEPSRSFLKEKGFVLVQAVNRQDDYYIHKRIIDSTDSSATIVV